jgi:hypothetical protein
MADITNELLKQAIADAETVRQTAIANAKIALEETFTPQIKSMLAKRLRAEAAQETVEGAEQVTEKIESAQGAAPVTSESAPSVETVESTDVAEQEEANGDGDWYDTWSDSDFDLDEIIKELEADVKALTGADDETSNGEHSEEEKTTNDAYSMEKNVEDERKAAVATDADKMAAETTEVSPDVTVVAAPGAATAEGEAPMVAVDGEEGGEEELDLEMILRELEADDEKEKKSSEEMAHKLESIRNELAEYRKVVNVLRGKLQEVNLLNAKLLYTNKIFRKDGLTTEQKVTILESFDRATNVREVKMVYTTLVETMTVAAKSVKSRTSSSKVVAEGLASMPIPSTAPKKDILEENTVAKRLQQLAGIL